MMAEKSDRELLEELDVDITPEKKAVRTPREERIIAGFEEIQRFVDEHGHPPAHGESKDIFERLYATRLDRVRSQQECRNLVAGLDHQGLLEDSSQTAKPPTEDLSDKELLAELGIDSPNEGDVTFLKHVKTRAKAKAVDEIASRTPCKDFAVFKPQFDAVQAEINSGIRETILLDTKAQIKRGDWFILFGQKAYVAEISKQRIYGFDRNDYRLRIIYDNATESDLLLRSLQKALGRDEAGRRIVELPGPLFGNVVDDDDLASGILYVLTSKSNLPEIRENKNIIHKLGVTGGSIEKRIANAKLDPTYLMADVEVVRSYELYNINRTKLEHILHKFLENVRIDIQINDRFGNPVTPREWFLVPLPVIDEVVEKIKNKTLSQYYYDKESASLRSLTP